MLLDGVHHIAWISEDVARLGRFYAEVFDAEVGPTRPHREPDRRTPMWGRGRIDHVGFGAATAEAFEAIRRRLVEAGASDGRVNDFGGALSLFFRDPDGLEGRCCCRRDNGARAGAGTRAGIALRGTLPGAPEPPHPAPHRADGHHGGEAPICGAAHRG